MTRDERFEACFLKYKNLVMRFVIDATGDYQAAQEICQQVFVRYYEYIDRVSPDFEKAWLIRCTQNAVIDYLRKNKNRVPVIDLDTALDMLSEDPFSDVSWILEEKEKSEFLKRALFRMKIEHNNWYEVILMSYVQRMDNISIGNEFGVSAALVSKWKERAHTWLRDAYIKEEQNESGDETSPD